MLKVTLEARPSKYCQYNEKIAEEEKVRAATLAIAAGIGGGLILGPIGAVGALASTGIAVANHEN